MPLTIVIAAGEMWDEQRQEFFTGKEMVLHLEHSLLSLSKWESKWHKPFLSTKDKTEEEMRDYIRCMSLTPNVTIEDVYRLKQNDISVIADYINDPMTATWFSNDKKRPSREIITNEVIYSWMVALNIPFVCEKWHLNRLLTLVQVCNIMNQPKKKMSRTQTVNSNKALNKARREASHSKG